MNDDDRDELIRALARGERVSRHDYDICTSTMGELEQLELIERDDEGFYRRGELFELHIGLFDDSLSEE